MVDQRVEDFLGVAPRLTANADVRLATLIPEDAFLLSQVDGVTPAGVLCDVVAMEPSAFFVAMTRLEEAGMIVWRQLGSGGGPVNPSGGAGPDGGGPRPPEVGQLPSVRCDLSPDEREQIRRSERDFQGQTHWQILGLTGNVTAGDVKRAYFALSKSFHPDRFFGRELGPFRERVDRLFELIKNAHDVLIHDQKRAAYRRRFPPPDATPSTCAPAPDATPSTCPPPPDGASSEGSEERVARLEQRRQEILAERRSRRLQRFRPAAAGSATIEPRGEELYHHGVSQMRSGDMLGAAASFKLALSFDQNSAKYREAFEEANGRAAGGRARKLAEAADMSEATGDSLAAAEKLVQAFEVMPSKAEYATRAAQLFLDHQKLKEADRCVRHALEVAPKRMEVLLMAAAVAEAKEDFAGALAHLQHAQTLEGSDGRVRKAIKRVSRRQGKGAG